MSCSFCRASLFSSLGAVTFNSCAPSYETREPSSRSGVIVPSSARRDATSRHNTSSGFMTERLVLAVRSLYKRHGVTFAVNALLTTKETRAAPHLTVGLSSSLYHGSLDRMSACHSKRLDTKGKRYVLTSFWGPKHENKQRIWSVGKWVWSWFKSNEPNDVNIFPEWLFFAIIHTSWPRCSSVVDIKLRLQS